MKKQRLFKKILKNKIIRNNIGNKNLYNLYTKLFDTNYFLIPILSLKSESINYLRIYLKSFNYKVLKIKLSFINNLNLSGQYLLLYNLSKNFSKTELIFFMNIFNKLFFNLNLIGFYHFNNNFSKFYFFNNLLLTFDQDQESKFKLINCFTIHLINLLYILNMYILYLFNILNLMKNNKNA